MGKKLKKKKRNPNLITIIERCHMIARTRDVQLFNKLSFNTIYCVASRL